MVQLESAHQAMVGLGGTGLLSFHCQEREVVAALCNQPHAVPSTLRAMRPGALAQAPWFKLLAWNGQARKEPQQT
ncbi:hypothetical protein O6P43_001231 [Quillaja saponaria]|uniref:Uncharacterized protein n=1 Tax=Quillaja saponaria TaxID=32244 RepID=A0AAD7VNQ1_QUISA|nr:hypothetical protein O6P43_001231 [Quillaja saponaria]